MIVWFRSGVWWSGKTPDTSLVPDSSPCITMVAAFRSGENKSTRPTRREPLYIKVWCLVDLRPYGGVWKAPDTPRARTPRHAAAASVADHAEAVGPSVGSAMRVQLGAFFTQRFALPVCLPRFTGCGSCGAMAALLYLQVETKQADDDTLRKHADRIQARAMTLREWIRHCTDSFLIARPRGESSGTTSCEPQSLQISGRLWPRVHEYMTPGTINNRYRMSSSAGLPFRPLRTRWPWQRVQIDAPMMPPICCMGWRGQQ